MTQLRLTSYPAILARLMIYPCIISVVGISSYSDGNFLARPDSGWTKLIATNKPAHDIRIILVHATFAIVFVVKMEVESVVAKKVGHVVVE